MSRERDPAVAEDVVPASVRRRREDAARARRRQLLLIDAGAALLLALVFIVLAPGLAIVAVGSLLVLAGCGASLAYGRVRTRIHERPRRR